MLFILPGVDLIKAKILDVFLSHQVVLHPTFQVADLEFLTPFRHQLMLIQTRVVSDGVLLALVKVIQGKRPFVRCGRLCA